MAEGSRITEEGFYRVTESLDQRITEQFAPLYATSSLTASGTQLSIGGIILAAVSSLVGSLSELSASTITASATSSLTAIGTVTGSADHYKNFIASINGVMVVEAKLGYLLNTDSNINATGSVSAQPSIIRNVDAGLNSSLSTLESAHLIFDVYSSLNASLSTDVIPKFTAKAEFSGSSTGSITPIAYAKFPVFTNLQGISEIITHPRLIEAAISLVGGTGSVKAYGGFLATGIATLNSTGLMNGSAQMILNAVSTNEVIRRITESGDPRIINTGEFRALSGEANKAVSTIDTTVSVTPFVQGLYAKVGSYWGAVTARVKRSGTWVRPTVYVKDNGTWKRVY